MSNNKDNLSKLFAAEMLVIVNRIYMIRIHSFLVEHRDQFYASNREWLLVDWGVGVRRWGGVVPLLHEDLLMMMIKDDENDLWAGRGVEYEVSIGVTQHLIRGRTFFKWMKWNVSGWKRIKFNALYLESEGLRRYLWDIKGSELKGEGTKYCENLMKSQKVKEDQWKSLEIYENWKESMEPKDKRIKIGIFIRFGSDFIKEKGLF